MSELKKAIIRARAHALWEEAGKPLGRHQDFWQQAEREMPEGVIAHALKLKFGS